MSGVNKTSYYLLKGGQKYENQGQSLTLYMCIKWSYILIENKKSIYGGAIRFILSMKMDNHCKLRINCTNLDWAQVIGYVNAQHKKQSFLLDCSPRLERIK